MYFARNGVVGCEPVQLGLGLKRKRRRSVSWSLSIYGHDAPSEDVKAAAREAFAVLAEKGGANGGSVSGQGNDGIAISINFPEPVSEPAETE